MHTEVQQQLQSGAGPIPQAKSILYNGKTFRVYTVGWLSYMTYLSVVTIRLWERQQILPKPIFKLAKNLRWYTAAELILYSSAIRNHYQTDRDKIKLKVALQKLGIEIRRKYTGTAQLESKYYALADEAAIVKGFRKRNFTSKLAANEFFEVRKLVNGEKLNASNKVSKIKGYQKFRIRRKDSENLPSAGDQAKS